LEGDCAKQALSTELHSGFLLLDVPHYRGTDVSQAEPFVRNASNDCSFNVDVLLPPRSDAATPCAHFSPVFRSAEFALQNSIRDFQQRKSFPRECTPDSERFIVIAGLGVAELQRLAAWYSIGIRAGVVTARQAMFTDQQDAIFTGKILDPRRRRLRELAERREQPFGWPDFGPLPAIDPEKGVVSNLDTRGKGPCRPIRRPSEFAVFCQNRRKL
jgi:hypothetical protein